jgi:hypothetical protein
MKRILCLHAAAAMLFVMVLAAPAFAEQAVTLSGKDAWSGVSLTGFNPYGDKKSFYPTPLKFADWANFTVHSRGSDARQGAEEKSALIRFDLSKMAKDAKVKSAKLVMPIQRGAGKKNAVQAFQVLAPWTDQVDWKTTDGQTPWETEGVHGAKDKKAVGAVDVPDQQFDPKAPTDLSIDVTDLVKAWVAGGAANNGLKLEMTGGYVSIGMKGFRLEITLE